MAKSPVGDEGPRCGAKLRQSDGHCRKEAGWGTKHLGEGPCRLHGGNTPTVAKGARLRLVEREALELFGQIAPDPAPVANPLAAYAEFAGEVLAWKNLMRSLLDKLHAASYDDPFGIQHAETVVELYERSMDRANTVLSSYAKLRIDERLAEITERQKQTVIRAIEAALAEAGLEGEARANAKRTAALHLRSVA